MELGYVKSVDSAVIPVEPVGPRVLSEFVREGCVGLYHGIASVFVRARVDDRVRTQEDLKRFGFVAPNSSSDPGARGKGYDTLAKAG